MGKANIISLSSFEQDEEKVPLAGKKHSWKKMRTVSQKKVLLENKMAIPGKRDILVIKCYFLKSTPHWNGHFWMFQAKMKSQNFF